MAILLSGIACPYSLSCPQRNADGDPFTETYLRGCFSEFLASGTNLRAVVNHNLEDGPICGAFADGTFAAHETDHGLRVELVVPIAKQPRAIELISDLRDYCAGWSICRRVPNDSLAMERRDGVLHYEIRKATLDEISAVLRPATPALTTTLLVTEITEIEAALRIETNKNDFARANSNLHIRRKIALARYCGDNSSHARQLFGDLLESISQ